MSKRCEAHVLALAPTYDKWTTPAEIERLVRARRITWKRAAELLDVPRDVLRMRARDLHKMGG